MSVGTSKIRWCWIIGSSAALALGAAIALALYPEAGFKGQTDQVGWYLVGFALSVGLPLALLQCLLLASALQHYSVARVLGLLLWIPVTTSGIGAIFFPLWWLSTFIMWFSGAALLSPLSVVALGVTQWLILRWLFDIKPHWITDTFIGVIIGGVIGAWVATLMASVLPREVTWAGVMGGTMGVLQALSLARPRERQ